MLLRRPHQICESAGAGSAAVCVTLFSIANAASRVIAGHCTDIGMQQGIQEASRSHRSGRQGTSAVDLYGNVNSSVSPSFAAEARAVLRTRPAFLIYLNAGMAVSQVGDYHL